MEKAGRFIRDWLLPDKAVVVFCAILLMFVWTAAWLQIEHDRRTTLEAIRNDGDKFTRAFEEHVRTVIKTHEQYLLLMKNEYEREQAVTPAMERLLAQLRPDALLIHASIFNDAGYAVISTLQAPPAISIAGVPHFAGHAAAGGTQTYIGRPFDGRLSKTLAVHLSQRINKPDGSFAGVSVVAIDPHYFSKFYRQMDLDENYTARLIGLDGVIRASNSVPETGVDFSEAVLFREVAKRPAGFYYAPGTQFGKTGYMSYRVMPDYPLVVQVGLSPRALLPLAQRRDTYLAAAGGASLFIVIYTGRLLIRSRRQRLADLELQGSYEELTAAHEELTAAHEELTSTEEELRSNYAALADERAFSSAVLESVPGLLYLYEDSGRIVRWNKNHETATGYSAEEMATRTLADWYSYDEKTVERVYEAAGNAFEQGAANAEFYLQNKDGSKTPYYFTAVRTIIDGKPYIAGIGIDISERIKMESVLLEKEQELQRSLTELTASHEELSALYEEVVATNEKLVHSRRTAEEIFHAAGDGFVVCDGDSGEILSVNRRLTEMFGYTEEEFKQQGIILISTPANLEVALATFRRAVVDGPQPLFERETLDRYGNRLIIEVSAGPVTIDGKTRCLALMRDVTVRKQLEEGLDFLRMRDPLTGVYNRAYFETEMLRAQVGEGGTPGIFVCDVDGLKLINDTLGHLQGDELLKKVAAILEAGVQTPDFVARIGGDEFAVIVYSPTKKRMEALDQYYREAVEAYNKEHLHLPLSLSLGWAIGASSAGPDSVFKEADNNMYRQKLHQSQSVRGSIVQTMMKAMEERDHITEGHADRLGDLMEKMGHRLQLPQGTIADIRLLANFHDIGKVGIPDGILNKPGPLTDEEMAIMRRHCEIGYRIAKASPDLEPIADWILKHQEHWNGGGYPLGIAGESIPLACRILGIVDAYDAMTNDRPYRKAMPPGAALAELRRCAGTQFDPLLVDLFIALAESDL
ncbi:MAG: diguanylate cyclase [Sporomusaceae bacterium]|nr:diguanylate cyclase [Sporomusaceae bacterium]